MKQLYDNKLRIKIQPLVDLICDYNQISPKLIDSKSQKRAIVQSRYMVLYYLKEHTTYSNSVMAAIFNKDHAVSNHAFTTISNLMDCDLKLQKFDKDNAELIKGTINDMLTVNPYADELRKRLIEFEINLTHGCI